jgi:adenylylsulfate kinase-like enzyme
MIYWFTGQPSHGKTTLAKLLIEEIKNFTPNKVFHIDGDDLRSLTKNQDYSEQGRIDNVKGAQKIAHYLHNQGHVVVVSLVSPFKWQREEFKEFLKENINEIYVHTNQKRERDNFKVVYYEQPTENFINVDTTFDSPEESIKKIIKQIAETNEKLYSTIK